MPPYNQPQQAPKRWPKWVRRLIWGWVILTLVGFGCSLLLRGYATTHGGGETVVAQFKLKSIEAMLKIHKLTHGSFPTEEDGLATIFETSDKSERGRERALEAIKDPWKRNFRYHIPGKHNPGSYDLYSLGPDGEEDTEDDIKNW